MSEMMQKCGLSTHSNAGICGLCNQCLYCHHNDCMGYHRTSRGSEGKATTVRRNLYWDEIKKAEGSRPQREAASKIGCLNVDKLQLPITSAIQQMISPASGETEERRFRMREIAEALGATISKHAEERTFAYSFDSLLDAETTKDEACVAVQALLLEICRQLTEDNQACNLLYDLVCERAFLRKNKSWNNDTIEVIADGFVRSLRNSLRERSFYAVLVHITKHEGLVDIIEAAVERALNCPKFMRDAQSKFYSDKKNTEVECLSDDDLQDDDINGDSTTSNETVTTSESGTKKKARALVEVTVEKQLRRKIRWPSSLIRKTRAIEDYECIEQDKPFPKIWSRPRVSLDSLLIALGVMEELSKGWKGGATHTTEIGNAEVKNLPVLNMDLSKTRAYDQYSKLADENGYIHGHKKIGYPSFAALYDGIARLVQARNSLSYYYTDALSALNSLKEMLERLEELWVLHHLPDSPPSCFEEFTVLEEENISFKRLASAIVQSINHVKYGLRSHITMDDCRGNALHCANLAVGKACLYQTSHRTGLCVACDNFVQLPDAVRKVMNAVRNSLAREHPSNPDFEGGLPNSPGYEILSMAEPISWCQTAINLYQRHVVRGLWQDKAVKEAEGSLLPGTVLITLDHKQKIQPVNFQESSEDYFGKRGISLLGFAVKWRDIVGGDTKLHYIDVVCSQSNQDAKQVQSLFTKALAMVKDIVPAVKEIILLSDNGAAFSSTENMMYIWERNRDGFGLGVRVSRWIFFEAQCGKTLLDTHFSFVGIVIRRYAREVQAVKVPRDVFKALEYGEGIANSSAMFIVLGGDDESELPASRKKTISGIRKVHDVIFEESGIVTYDFSNVPSTRATYKYTSSNSINSTPLSAVISSTFRGSIVDPIRRVAKGSKISAPAISVKPSATIKPHDALTAEALISFSSTSRQYQLERLFAEGPQEIPASLDNSALQTKDIRPTFGEKWAHAKQRTNPVLGSNLVTELRCLVSIIALSYNYKLTS